MLEPALLHHRNLAATGLLLREVAARSEGGYVLIRRGRRRDADGGGLEWRVNVKHQGRQWVHVSLEGPEHALARALARLLDPQRRHVATLDDATVSNRVLSAVWDRLDGG